MSFHPDIISLARFTPHALSDLVTMHAFPTDSMPEAAYAKLCKQYEEAADIEVQRITYLNDGLKITGLIAAPTGQYKGIVVYNRGGSGNYGILTVHAVMRQLVPLARAGYLVVGSNYRGNDGGEAKDEFGGGDVGDVVKLHAIATSHPAASGPTYIIGHSRGGMMSFLLLKHGFPARAAIAIAPVCDLTGWNQARSEMRERVYKRFIPGFLEHEEESLEGRSVLQWPEAINAPLLLLHGTKDDAVPHSQSEMLAAALERLGKPHALVLYEGGNHALTRHWDDVMKRILDWLERHG